MSTSYSFSTTSAGTTIQFTFRPTTPPVPDAFVDRLYDALSWLELDLPITQDSINKARKRLSRQHHPDLGGDAEVMKQINAAADVLGSLLK